MAASSSLCGTTSRKKLRTELSNLRLKALTRLSTSVSKVDSSFSVPKNFSLLDELCYKNGTIMSWVDTILPCFFELVKMKIKARPFLKHLDKIRL